ncbi:MAG: hypothetical protein ABR530_03040 [Pyrinomonadaceae bacterium]
MRSKFLTFIAIVVLMSNAVVFATADKKPSTAGRQTSRLVSLLPASDGVAVFDAKRFLNDALPRVMSANQPLLSEIMAKISQMESRTGIDLRKFDQVAIGIAIKQVSAKELDYEPVAIASGDINAGALVAVARLASNGTYRLEKIGGKTVYVFSVKDVAKKVLPVQTTNSKIAGYIDDALTGISHDVAVTALDRNTLVIGSFARVRETLEGRSRISADVSSLLSTKDTAVASFAFRSAGGLSRMLPLDNDELGMNLDSIQYLYGSADVSAAGTLVQLVARTKQPDQAKGLRETIEGLQVIGNVLLGSSKAADKQVYARMLKNAKFDQRGNEVSLDLLVPQSDIDILIAGHK